MKRNLSGLVVVISTILLVGTMLSNAIKSPAVAQQDHTPTPPTPTVPDMSMETNNSDESYQWTETGQTLQLIFARGTFPAVNLYIVNEDGTDVRQITDGPRDLFPAWSPDGEWIVFTRSDTGDTSTVSIYRVHPDGSELQLLSQGAGRAWSPDGQKIVFRKSEGGGSNIYQMDSDGSNVQQLTENEADENVSPEFSPDGNSIVFVKRGTQRGIYRMNADGSDQRPLVTLFPNNGQPHWSPDGQWISFIASRVGEGPNLYIVSPDGEDLRQLTFNNNVDFGLTGPSWSPDSEWITYATEAAKLRSIRAIRISGTDVPVPLRLTTTGDSYDPVWSPDGRWIAYAVIVSQDNADLYLVRPDGSEIRQLTDSPMAEGLPLWSPVVEE